MPVTKKAPVIKKKKAPKKRISTDHLHKDLILIIEQNAETHKQLTLISKKQIKIMATQQDLQNKIDELIGQVDVLQQKVDAEQADVAALLSTNAQVVSDLTAERDALQAIVDAGGADLQPSIDKINAVIAKVEAASTDVESTV